MSGCRAGRGADGCGLWREGAARRSTAARDEASAHRNMRDERREIQIGELLHANSALMKNSMCGWHCVGPNMRHCSNRTTPSREIKTPNTRTDSTIGRLGGMDAPWQPLRCRGGGRGGSAPSLCDHSTHPETPQPSREPPRNSDAPQREQGVTAPSLGGTTGGVRGEGLALPGVATSS